MRSKMLYILLFLNNITLSEKSWHLGLTLKAKEKKFGERKQYHSLRENENTTCIISTFSYTI